MKSFVLLLTVLISITPVFADSVLIRSGDPATWPRGFDCKVDMIWDRSPGTRDLFFFTCGSNNFDFRPPVDCNTGRDYAFIAFLNSIVIEHPATAPIVDKLYELWLLLTDNNNLVRIIGKSSIANPGGIIAEFHNADWMAADTGGAWIFGC